MTEGFLLRESLRDKLFSHYDAVILDEVHERNIELDILLALLSKAVKLRRAAHFKLVLMSATIDISKFQAYFESSGYISIPGKQYKVALHYLAAPTEHDSF